MRKLRPVGGASCLLQSAHGEFVLGRAEQHEKCGQAARLLAHVRVWCAGPDVILPIEPGHAARFSTAEIRPRR
jgi:hypothetical protein